MMSVLTQTAPGLCGFPRGLPRVTPIDREVFTDGLRTSGQHPPVEGQIKPYQSFPKSIQGPTVWRPADLAAHPEEWIHTFTKEELTELEDATDSYIASGTPLVAITKVSVTFRGVHPEPH